MTDLDEPNEVMYIVNRPLYRVIVLINGADVDVNIILTAKGKQYARGRARGDHRFIHNDDEAIAEIMSARDNYFPAILPSGKYSFDT